MNKNIFKLLTVGAFLVVLSACSKDDGDVSTITSAPMTIASIDADVAVAEEAGEIVTVNFMMDEDQIVDTKVAIAVDPLKTTATEGVDFVLLTQEVGINAYARSGSFQVQIISDLLAEGDEVAAFTVSGVQDPFGATNVLEYNITINDYVDNEALHLTFDWDGLGFYQGIGYSLCDNVDLDIYFLDDMGMDAGIYVAATGACPEVIVFDATWDDGVYTLASNMWANGFAGLESNNDFPIRIAIDKPGIYNESFTPVDVWTSEDADQSTGGNAAFYAALTVEKAGNVYTVTQPDGTQIIQGLNAPPAHKLASPKMNIVGQ